ncbi:hypothetical protein BV22DRAFT_1134545 [Leucogyrophana mollusca]|uniref:Uncharacterized protein n=1 Tax=Leucogyrophana mollusca TaxID=85980 RepID=A0ACB8AZ06_9AGAM|nr:hypothetical protein BV22DRAFT_1134545 [Leucogyrophana mollusca]
MAPIPKTGRTKKAPNVKGVPDIKANIDSELGKKQPVPTLHHAKLGNKYGFKLPVSASQEDNVDPSGNTLQEDMPLKNKSQLEGHTLARDVSPELFSQPHANEGEGKQSVGERYTGADVSPKIKKGWFVDLAVDAAERKQLCDLKKAMLATKDVSLEPGEADNQAEFGEEPDLHPHDIDFDGQPGNESEPQEETNDDSSTDDSSSESSSDSSDDEAAKATLKRKGKAPQLSEHLRQSNGLGLDNEQDPGAANSQTPKSKLQSSQQRGYIHNVKKKSSYPSDDSEIYRRSGTSNHTQLSNPKDPRDARVEEVEDEEARNSSGNHRPKHKMNSLKLKKKDPRAVRVDEVEDKDTPCSADERIQIPQPKGKSLKMTNSRLTKKSKDLRAARVDEVEDKNVPHSAEEICKPNTKPKANSVKPKKKAKDLRVDEVDDKDAPPSADEAAQDLYDNHYSKNRRPHPPDAEHLERIRRSDACDRDTDDEGEEDGAEGGDEEEEPRRMKCYGYTAKDDIEPTPHHLRFYPPTWKTFLEECKVEVRAYAAINNAFSKKKEAIRGFVNEVINMMIVSYNNSSKRVDEGYYPMYRGRMAELLFADLPSWRGEIKKAAVIVPSSYPIFPPQNANMSKSQYIRYVKKAAGKLIRKLVFAHGGKDDEDHTNNFGHTAIRQLLHHFLFRADNQIGMLRKGESGKRIPNRLGFDPTIRVTPQPTKPSFPPTKLALVSDLLLPSLNSPIGCVMGRAPSTVYDILEIVWSNQGFIGRGTTVYCVRSKEGKEYVLKDYWVKANEAGHKAAILEKIVSLKIDGVPTLVEKWNIPFNGQDDTTETLRKGLITKHLPASFCAHIHRCLLMTPVGLSITLFRSQREPLSGLCDVIRNEQLVRVGILHCDISCNNLLLYKLDPKAPPSNTGEEGFCYSPKGTGTLPFLSISLLRILSRNKHKANGKPQERIQYQPADNLESFFYVLLWICTFYSGPDGELCSDKQFKETHCFDWSENALKASSYDAGLNSKEALVFGNYNRVFDGITPYFQNLNDLLLFKWHTYIQTSYTSTHAIPMNHGTIISLLTDTIERLPTPGEEQRQRTLQPLKDGYAELKLEDVLQDTNITPLNPPNPVARILRDWKLLNVRGKIPPYLLLLLSTCCDFSLSVDVTHQSVWYQEH